MNTKRTQQELWTATAEAARESNVVRFRPDPSPCPGDTFVFRETAEVPVEWAVVERDPMDVRKLLVVPLDAYPQIGSHDLGLHFGEPGRVANIRCDVDAWLEASRFEPKLRTGMLPAASVGDIQHKRQTIASGELAASLLEEKVDGDPEYRRWKDETLGAALAELKAGRQPQRSRAPLRRRYAVAASAVLVMGALWSVRHMQLLHDQLDARDLEVAEVTRQHGELQDKLEVSGREVAELRGEIESLTDTSRELEQRDRQVAKLRRELAANPLRGVLANLPVSFLRGGRTRGEHPVRISEGAPRVALVVEVIDPEPYGRYRLEILDKERGGAQIWGSDQLRRSGSTLSLSLPSSLFDPGYYDMFLYGIGDDGTEVRLKESYLMKVLWVSAR